uniref:Uncharacterized protein n=1 Tax=Quercus lobata TaxID=97700 RepID=A0A7N2RF77_QUELO
MVRNKNKAVMEKHMAMSEEMAKMVSIEWLSRIGFPFSSLMLPGTVVDEAKATVAMSAVKTEQDSERETRKRDVNIKGTDIAILLGLPATLNYRQLAWIGGCGSGYGGGGGSIIQELPTGVFWGLKDSGSTAFFVDHHAR